MSARSSIFLLFLLLFGCSAVTLLSGVLEETPVTVSTTAKTELRQKMERAYSNGATLFQYKIDVAGIALCNGNQRIVDLDTSIKEVKLTSRERASLTLCKYDFETESYYMMQDIDSSPGDYLVWETSGLCGLRYE